MNCLTNTPATPCEEHKKTPVWASLRTVLVLGAESLLGLTDARVAAVDGIHGVTNQPIE